MGHLPCAAPVTKLIVMHQLTDRVQMLNAQHLLVEPAGSTLPLPQTLCDMQLPLAVHLSHEAHLLDLLSGVLAAYRAIRVSTQYDPAHLDDLILAVETYAAETSIWRDRLASSSRTGKSAFPFSKISSRESCSLQC